MRFVKIAGAQIHLWRKELDVGPATRRDAAKPGGKSHSIGRLGDRYPQTARQPPPRHAITMMRRVRILKQRFREA